MKKNKFGKAFSDELNKVSVKSNHFKGGRNEETSWEESLLFGGGKYQNTESTLLGIWSKTAIALFLIIIFGLLSFRLFHLQVVEGKTNRELADSNRIQVKVIHAPRGVVYDRNGKILAQNEPGFRLVEGSASAKTARFISRDEALKMEVQNDPNFKNLEIDSVRNYPQKEKTAHILGFVSEITEDELKAQEDESKSRSVSFYKIGDKVGRGGVEQSFEKILRGVDGGEIIEVDAEGKSRRVLRKTEAIPGQNLYLTIDADLQNIAYDKLHEALEKKKSCCGAVVAEDPNNGQILALVSIPSYDPTKLQSALTAPNSPILNRAISGTYPPGSTFKIVSSLAGLESGKITKETSFEDTGVLQLGPFSFANWYFTQYGRKEDGLINVTRALKRSNDIYFYRLGQIVGEDTLADMSKQMGLGKALGIDIPGEAVGLIPDNQWKQENTGETWYPGDTLHMSIGQGFVLTTPLQINNLSSIIAANGRQYPPHLALKITESQGRTIKEYEYDPLNSREFKKENIELIKQGMLEVTQDGGTAWPFFTFPFKTAGKTGTAEFGGKVENGKTIYQTHAWYTAYAPVDAPTISLTVLLEGGGEGSTDASPVAKEILRFYLSPDKKNLVKDIVNISTESAKPVGE